MKGSPVRIRASAWLYTGVSRVRAATCVTRGDRLGSSSTPLQLRKGVACPGLDRRRPIVSFAGGAPEHVAMLTTRGDLHLRRPGPDLDDYRIVTEPLDVAWVRGTFPTDGIHGHQLVPEQKRPLVHTRTS